MKQDKLYKIVIGKTTKEKKECEKIRVGKYYELDLHSTKENAPEIGGVKLNPVGYTGCYTYDEKTVICLEPEKDIYDIYYTEQLQGLCYVQ